MASQNFNNCLKKLLIPSLSPKNETTNKKSQSKGSTFDFSNPLCSSLKLEQQPSSAANNTSSKLLKSCSIKTQQSDLNDFKPIQEQVKNPIFREKLKLAIARNEKLLCNPQTKSTLKLENPENLNTLKKVVKVQKNMKKQALINVVEALKITTGEVKAK